jgi:trans-L-3-hydroxyproline dehydratase
VPGSKIKTIDAHTGGEPLRLITEGLPPIPGATILEKRRYMRENLDHLRTALMLEPRGHADMYGCILTEPCSPDGDFGVLFMHNEGYSTMCGHGVIALATIAVEAGLVKAEGAERVLRLDTPAGRVTAVAHLSGSVVTSVSFRNVPSFVLFSGETVEVEGEPPFRFDVAFGGAFYAIGETEMPLTPENGSRIARLGMAIKRRVMERYPIAHPFERDLGFLYGTILTGPPVSPARHSRNVCVFAEGEVDRSPTGTGVSARAAIHYFRGELPLRSTIEIESIVGSTFRVSPAEERSFGPHRAIVPEVSGRAFITGTSEFVLNPDDPLGLGFRIF